MSGSGRFLGGAEQLMWMADRISPLNFLLCAAVDGPLNFDAIRAGVNATVDRYPALGLSIESSASGKARLVQTTRPITIDVLGADNWVTHATQEINRPFECPHEPLFRVRWLRAQSSHQLMLTMHHSIADGRAGLAVLNTFLSQVNAHMEGKNQFVDAIEHGPPIEERAISSQTNKNHPVAARGLRFNDAERGAGTRRTLIFSQSLSTEQTLKIKTTARQLGCTVHGLLSATHLQAVAEEHGSGVCTLSLSSPIDLRSRIADFIDEELGLFVANSKLVYRVDPTESPAGLARRISGDIKRASQSNTPLAPDFDGRLASVKKIYEARASTAISNLGVIRLDDDMKTLGVREIHFAVACSTMGDQIVTTAYHGGRMTWCLCAAQPSISPERAQRVAQRSMDKLFEVTEHRTVV